MRVLSGVDLESTERFKKLFNKKPEVLKKCFLKSEWDFAVQKYKPWETLAGIWCAKEAGLKCLNEIIENISLKNFRVIHDSNGSPKLELNGSNQPPQIVNISLSISHNKLQTIAVVTALVR